MELLNLEFFGNTILNLSYAGGMFFGVIFLRYLLKFTFSSYLISLTEKSETNIDNILLTSLDRFLGFGFFIFALYLSKFFINLPISVDSFANQFLKISLTVFVIYVFQKLIADLIANYFDHSKKKTEKYFSSLVKNVSNILIWGIGVTFILSELGYNISTLVAGLGISGIAIALAIQPTLASIFASFSIFFDKPFKVGDMVNVSGFSGIIKNIGLRTTRLRTFDGTEVVFSNTAILEASVENVSERKTARVDLSLGVVYEISTKKLKESMILLRKILEKQEGVNAEDVRVYFKDFGDFSLNILVTYFIEKLDLDSRLQIQSEVNFAIKEQFEKEKIDFAYPTSLNLVKKI